MELWKLKTQTREVFQENVYWCHLQVAIGKAALVESPPSIDPCKYGWKLNPQGVIMPCIIPAGTNLPPPFILELIHCKVSNCQTASCSCSSIGCTIFCLCGGGQWCRNPLTHANVNSDEEDTTEEAAETAWVSFDYI